MISRDNKEEKECIYISDSDNNNNNKEGEESDIKVTKKREFQSINNNNNNNSLSLSSISSNDWLSDKQIDYICKDLFQLNRREDVLYISSVEIQCALKKFIIDFDRDITGKRFVTNDKHKDNNTRRRSALLIQLGFKREDITNEKSKLYKFDTLFIPINGPFTDLSDAHKNNHWSLLVYFGRLNRVYHYDSIPGRNSERFSQIVDLLQNIGLISEFAIEKEGNIELRGYEQMSFWECGYYLLLAIVTITTTIPAQPLKQKHIEAFNHASFNRIKAFYLKKKNTVTMNEE